MPEGHTIHRLARDQRRDLARAPVRAETRQERFAAGAARLDGRVLDATEAWGKHLFHHYEGALVLHVHLGLFGKFRRAAVPVEQASPNLRLRLAGATHAWDLTGPITCRLGEPDLVQAVTATLGPDPLRPDADPERFVQRVRRSKAPIGALLMDQSVIAGIGNVFRAELLNLVGVHPRTPGRDVPVGLVLELWDLAVRLLRAGVRTNRIITVLDDPRPPSRIPRSEAWNVYKQEVCRRCATPVGTFDLGTRRAYVCPTCQPEPAA